MSLLPRLLSRDRHAGASLRERTWMNLVLISFCTGLTVDGTTMRPWKCHKWLNANFRNVVGPSMDFSVHVPNGYISLGCFQLTSNLRINRSICHGSESILLMYWSRGLFLWMVQPKSRFRNLKRRDGTTQEFVSGTFSCKFQSCLLAKYFILVNKLCCCSDINFVQTAVEGILILCCVLVSPLERG